MDCNEYFIQANTRARKPGGGRKPSKPEYSAAKNLAQQMKAAADLYTDKMSLQAIADALSLNPIKVRKLLITAGVYESDTAKFVQQTFDSLRSTQSYSAAVTSTMSALQLSRPSVTSYLPYEKGVYFPEEAEAANISAGAGREAVTLPSCGCAEEESLRRKPLEVCGGFSGIQVQDDVRLALYL